MSEKLLVSAYLNVGDIWHQDAKVIGTCWGFQLVHNVTEQIATNNPNKSLPMVMLDDANEALAAKDARIADLEQAIYDLRYAHRYAPTCQAGVVAKCQCWNCVVDRAVFPAAQQQDEPCNCPGSGKPEPEKHAPNCPVLKAATHSEDGGEVLMTAAARDVLAERRRQIEAEGWTPEHDDAHGRGAMALAAGCYARHAHQSSNWHGRVPESWPWASFWWKPKTARENLVRAGALILAEIERIDRASNKRSQNDD